MLSVYILETLNATNFSKEPWWYAIQVYTRVLGQGFFAALFLIPALYVYVNSDKNTYQTSIFLLIILAFFSAIIPTPVTLIIGLFVGFILTGVLVDSITKKRRQ